MKTAFQRNAQRKGNPLLGMLVVLGSICGFLAFLVGITAIVHFVVS